MTAHFPSLIQALRLKVTGFRYIYGTNLCILNVMGDSNTNIITNKGNNKITELRTILQNS